MIRRQRDVVTQSQRDAKTPKEKEITEDGEMQRQWERDTDSQRDKQRERMRNIERQRQGDRQTYRQRDKVIEKIGERDVETCRQIGREIK